MFMLLKITKKKKSESMMLNSIHVSMSNLPVFTFIGISEVDMIPKISRRLIPSR